MNKDFQVKLERLRNFLQIFADQHESIITYSSVFYQKPRKPNFAHLWTHKVLILQLQSTKC